MQLGAFATPCCIGVLGLMLGCTARPAGVEAGEKTPEPAPMAVASVDGGRLRGAVSGETFSFLGIPYAAPPIGALRFRRPEPLAAWSGERDATAFGAPCIQRRAEPKPSSEDCLTLNVWTPRARHAGLPVLFFVHGGGNFGGSTSTARESGPLYDGALLAEHGNAVVVTANYRLGPLGFVAHPALADARGASGNWGYFDLLAALAWVQRNAAAFGADPSRVLLFGQSAGAKNVCTLFASPAAKGLFSSALLESGRCLGRDAAKGRAVAEASGEGAARELGCAGSNEEVAHCLRALPASAFAGVHDDVVRGELRWGPTIDGELLSGTQAEVIATGHHNHVPLVVGTTSDEVKGLWREQGLALARDQATYDRDIELYFGKAHAAAILERYPPKLYESSMGALLAALTDGDYTCEARSLAKLVAGHQKEPVRRYLFTHSMRPGEGALHAEELYFVFRPLPLKWWTPSPRERGLAFAMMRYWSRFAATGDPNGDGAVAWPAFEGEREPTLILDETIAVDEHARTDICDFWQRELGY